MHVTRQLVLDILRICGQPDAVDEARQVLPDPVEYDQAELFLAQHGITERTSAKPPPVLQK